MRLGRAAASFEEEDDERLTFTRTNNVRLQQGRGGRGRGGYASLLQKVTGGTAVSAAEEGDEVVVEDGAATDEEVLGVVLATTDDPEDWQEEVRRSRLFWLRREESLIEDSDLEDIDSEEDEPATEGSSADFIATPTFDGPRPGYSFKADAQGVGYYQEPAGGDGGGRGGGPHPALQAHTGGDRTAATFVETEAEVFHTHTLCLSHPACNPIHRPTTHCSRGRVPYHRSPGSRLLGSYRWRRGCWHRRGRSGAERRAHDSRRR